MKKTQTEIFVEINLPVADPENPFTGATKEYIRTDIFGSKGLVESFWFHPQLIITFFLKAKLFL